MNIKILITGGLGYAGGRLSRALLSKGASVRLTTRSPTEEKPAWSRDLEVVRADLQAEDELEPLCDGMDAIIHLASMGARESAVDPVAAVACNGVSTLKLLQAARRAGCSRFIYFSTAHVYGAPLTGTITENTVPRPVHPYATTHRLAEDFVLTAHDRGEISGLVLRLSNGMGAPADPYINQWGLIANDLCRQAVCDNRLVLASSGLQQRNFIAFSDVARAVSHFLSLQVESWADGLFNLGGESSLTMIELAEIVARRAEMLLGTTPPIERPAPASDENWPALDYRIDKLKATGFALTGSLEAEIDATLQLCQEAFTDI